MATATRRTSQRVTLLMLVLASITVLTLDYRGEVSHGITHVRNGIRDAIAPLQRGVAAVLHPVGDVFAGAFHYGALQSQNARLAQEVGKLQAQAAEAAFAEHQAKSVLSLARLPYVGNIATVPAEVISAPTSNFADEVTVDRGTTSGIGPRMPVVSGRGLVGTVATAGSSTALVKLVTARSSTVGVTFGSTGKGATAIATGQGQGAPLLIESITGPAPVTGEIVFTSGTDAGAYPAGIPIATVTSVHTSVGGLTTSVTAVPLVDMGTLAYLGVLEWLPQP